jgi:hypothetical protein
MHTPLPAYKDGWMYFALLPKDHERQVTGEESGNMTFQCAKGGANNHA